MNRDGTDLTPDHRRNRRADDGDGLVAGSADRSTISKHIDIYRIEERLGMGGMGDVYRAHDESLDRSVAIKVIRAERAASDHARRRFSREARTVAKLKHPAIVHIYSVLEHEGNSCIVMEHVEGETLRERLKGGPMAPEEALPLLRQVAEGIAHAHDEGVIHRDLKAENVMVTRTGHAKILDFGLARHLGAENDSLSIEGAIMGTLYSMSPEQARGGQADHRSDLFSLGGLAYLMLTGEPPFTGKTRDELWVRLVHNPHRPADELNPRVPKELSDLIDRLLIKDPELRPQSAAEVATALDALARQGTSEATRPLRLPSLAQSTFDSTCQEVSASSTSPEPRRRIPSPGRVWGAWVRAAVAAVAVVALLFQFWVFSPQRPPTVAVLGFEGLANSRDDVWGTVALTEILRLDDRLRVLSGERVLEARKLGLKPGVPLATADFGYLSSILGADIVVAVDVESAAFGEVLVWEAGSPRKVELEISRDEPIELVLEVARRIRRVVGLPALEVDTASLLPAYPEPARLHAAGILELWGSQPRAARRLLEEAAAFEPGHPLVFEALARTYEELGYIAEAEEALGRARGTASVLPPRKQRQIEARWYEMSGEYEQAADAFRRLQEDFPWRIEFAVARVQNLSEAGKLEAARETLEELSRDGWPQADAAFLDIERAWVRFELGQDESALSLLRQAFRDSESAGALFIAAKAKYREGLVLEKLARFEKALQTLRQAKDLFDQIGHRQGVLDSLQEISILHARQGNLAEARQSFEQCQSAYQRRGDLHGLAGLEVNLANTLSRVGQHREAIAYFEKSLAVYEDLGERYKAAVVAVDLGAAHLELGNLAAARGSFDLARAEFQDLGNGPETTELETAQVLVNLSEVLLLQGFPVEARQFAEDALGLHEQLEIPAERAYVLLRLGEALTARGQLEEARARLEEARSNEVEKGMQAEILLAFAHLERHQNNFHDAVRDAQAAADLFQEAEMRDHWALANIAEARALLGQPDPDLVGAGQLKEDASLRVSNSENPRVRFEARLLTVHLQAHHDVETARAALADLVTDVTEHGYGLDALESRLALARIEHNAGLLSRDSLEPLITDARSCGCGLVEQRAIRFRAPR